MWCRGCVQSESLAAVQMKLSLTPPRILVRWMTAVVVVVVVVVA